MSVEITQHSTIEQQHQATADTIQMIAREFDLDNDEEIFDDFKCTVRTAAATNAVTDLVGRRIGGLIEHMGHIYLTDENICFCGHMLGETKFKIRFADIKSIVKSKTLGIIDWAIMVRVQPAATTTSHRTDPAPEQNYLFGAFENRDFVYKRMMDLWVSQVPEATEAKLWQQNIHINQQRRTTGPPKAAVADAKRDDDSQQKVGGDLKKLKRKKENAETESEAGQPSLVSGESGLPENFGYSTIHPNEQDCKTQLSLDSFEQLNTPSTAGFGEAQEEAVATDFDPYQDHDFDEEITQRQKNDADLKQIFEESKKEWKQHVQNFHELTVNQFWAEFLDENAKFGLDKLQELQSFWDVKYEPWKNSKRVMNLIAPVVNVPFINQTRVTRKITQIHKSDSKIIIDIESKAHDAPYSDTFVCKEMWAIFGSEKNPKHPKIQLNQYYYAKFLKYTLFKSQIAPRTEEGILQGLKKWQEYAEENGHLRKKDAVPTEHQHQDQFQSPLQDQDELDSGEMKDFQTARFGGKKIEEFKVSPRGITTATTDTEKEEIKNSEVELKPQRNADKQVKASTKKSSSNEDKLEKNRSNKVFKENNWSTSFVIPISFLLILVLMLTIQSISSFQRNSRMQLMIENLVQTQYNMESQLHSMNIQMDSMKAIKTNDCQQVEKDTLEDISDSTANYQHTDSI